MATEQAGTLLREREVTRDYKLTGAWLRKRRRLHLPPVYIRVGRMVFYSRRDLDGFVAAHRVEPNGHGSRAATAEPHMRASSPREVADI